MADDKSIIDLVKIEEQILQQKREFEASLKVSNDKKVTLSSEIEKAEKEIENINKNILESESLLNELCEAVAQTTYFADENQLKSINVKDATKTAAEFKALQRDLQKKEKELETQLTAWHTAQNEKLSQIGLLIDGYKAEIKAIDEDIVQKRKAFDEYIIANSEDKEMAKTILDKANQKEILNSFKAPIMLSVIYPSGKPYNIECLFSFKKEEGIWKYVGKSEFKYSKGLIKLVEMDFKDNDLTLNRGLRFDWKVEFAAFEGSIGSSENTSKTTGTENTDSTGLNVSKTDGMDISVGIENSNSKSESTNSSHTTGGEVEGKIFGIGASGKYEYQTGSEEEKTETTTVNASVNIKEETTVGVDVSTSNTKKVESTKGKENSENFTQKFDLVTSEGTVLYTISGTEDNFKLTSSGDLQATQQFNKQDYKVVVNDKNFVDSFK